MNTNNHRINNITAVDVYREFRKKRKYVGRLTKKRNMFLFKYDKRYYYGEKALALGPDIPLTSLETKSSKLFVSFEDRIPSKENPAYKEYCQMTGISPKEKNLFILLSSIGRKGPSCFIFAPVYDGEFQGQDLMKFRKGLKLSIREFADLFDFAFATIHRIEKGKSTGKDALKRIRIYHDFPQVALAEIQRLGAKINDEAREYVENFFKMKIKTDTKTKF